MILVIGGNYQGKLSYVLDEYNLEKKDILNGKDIDNDVSLNVKCIYNLNEYVKNSMIKEEDMFKKIDDIIFHNPNIILICDEVGSGIVPIDKFEREYRNLVGKLCCNLAKKADKVVRVFCSIPTVIKGYDYDN